MKTLLEINVLVALLITYAHAEPVDAMYCWSRSSFVDDRISYEETDRHFIFSMSGRSIGSAEFNYFEKIKIENWENTAHVFMVFNKTDCNVHLTDNRKEIKCALTANDFHLPYAPFYIQRFFRQFDYSSIDVISKLFAEKLEVEFNSSGRLTMIFTNAKGPDGEPNTQTLAVDRVDCEEGPHSLIPRRLKEYLANTHKIPS